MANRYNELATKFLALGYIEGEAVPREVLAKLLGAPLRQEGLSIKENDSRQFAFMGALEGLRKALLKQGHDLQAVGRSGRYRLVPFQERPRAAANDGRRAINKEIVRTIDRLLSIRNTEQLCGEAKQVRDSALLRFGHLRAIMNARDYARLLDGAEHAKEEVY